MPWPFLSNKDRKDWAPRAQIGMDPNLPPIERKILETIDILEQRCDQQESIAVQNRNILVVVSMIVLYANGSVALKLVMKWLGGAVP